MTRVCLIVDNPLRDLEGLVLLARTLALRGMEPFLVPMYTQAFDVAAIRPDLVVANYARPNNIDLIKAYRRRGIKVAVADTEGAGGRNVAEFISLVRQGGAVGNLDLYCAWGVAQFEALRELLGSITALTGCPRYDFCAPNWRPALRRPPVPPGFILVNTNFPTINPRFSEGAASERRTALKVGFSEEYAEQYHAVANQTLEGIIALIRALAERFPDQQFVLRPHPFENRERYAPLTGLANFSVHQEGTSLEWIAASSLLLHLNCSTAVEAVMLDKPAVSPAWLDAPALHIPGPSSVSLHARDQRELESLIEAAAAGQPLPVDQQCAEARRAVIVANYRAVDGESSNLVADAIETCLAQPALAGRLPPPHPRVAAIRLVQRALGARLWLALVDRLSGGARQARRLAKSFSDRQVQDVLNRLASVDGRRFVADQVQWRGTTGGSVRVRSADGLV